MNPVRIYEFDKFQQFKSLQEAIIFSYNKIKFGSSMNSTIFFSKEFSSIGVYISIV